MFSYLCETLVGSTDIYLAPLGISQSARTFYSKIVYKITTRYVCNLPVNFNSLVVLKIRPRKTRVFVLNANSVFYFHNIILTAVRVLVLF